MTTTSDSSLLAAARTDPHAFRELYERYAMRIHAFHLRRSRDEDSAHDLTAETFAQAWLSRKRFRDEAGGSAAPWLFAIARHVLLTSIRRRQPRASAFTAALPRSATSSRTRWRRNEPAQSEAPAARRRNRTRCCS